MVATVLVCLAAVVFAVLTKRAKLALGLLVVLVVVLVLEGAAMNRSYDHVYPTTPVHSLG